MLRSSGRAGSICRQSFSGRAGSLARVRLPPPRASRRHDALVPLDCCRHRVHPDLRREGRPLRGRARLLRLRAQSLAGVWQGVSAAAQPGHPATLCWLPWLSRDLSRLSRRGVGVMEALEDGRFDHAAGGVGGPGVSGRGPLRRDPADRGIPRLARGDPAPLRPAPGRGEHRSPGPAAGGRRAGRRRRRRALHQRSDGHRRARPGHRERRPDARTDQHVAFTAEAGGGWPEFVVRDLLVRDDAGEAEVDLGVDAGRVDRTRSTGCVTS